MLKIRVAKETLIHGIKYHCSNDLGLDVVLDDDSAVAEWFMYALQEHNGFSKEVFATVALTTNPEDDSQYVIEAPADVMKEIADDYLD